MSKILSKEAVLISELLDKLIKNLVYPLANQKDVSLIQCGNNLVICYGNKSFVVDKHQHKTPQESYIGLRVGKKVVLKLYSYYLCYNNENLRPLAEIISPRKQLSRLHYAFLIFIDRHHFCKKEWHISVSVKRTGQNKNMDNYRIKDERIEIVIENQKLIVYSKETKKAIFVIEREVDDLIISCVGGKFDPTVNDFYSGLKNKFFTLSYNFYHFHELLYERM